MSMVNKLSGIDFVYWLSAWSNFAHFARSSSQSKLMKSVLSNQNFHQLVTSLKRPSKTAKTETYWPYPLPEADMIARYGLRHLTQVEQQMFPGLCLVLNISKVYLTRPPAVIPAAKAGWVVWVAETYPGHYLVRMPGGATLPAPFTQMAWTAVSDESDHMPITTLADVKAEAWQLKWRTAVRQNIHRNLRI
jgi:hypothetical protein